MKMVMTIITIIIIISAILMLAVPYWYYLLALTILLICHDNIFIINQDIISSSQFISQVIQTMYHHSSLHLVDDPYDIRVKQTVSLEIVTNLAKLG